MSRHRFLIASLALLLLIPAVAGASEKARLIRCPDLDPSGSRIAFSYQGDIWTAGIDGQGARRITIHEAYETHPRWSPDGTQIAFSSNRYGNYDVYSVPFDGGMPNRLTWHSAADEVTDWSSKMGILFSSKRLFSTIDWDTELMKVDPAGGTPSASIKATGREAVASPDGRFIAFIRGSCRVQRETYAGPASRQVWLYDTKNDKYTLVTEAGAQHSMPRWAGPGALYYLSAAPGRYNIFRVGVDEAGNVGEAAQVTSFTEDGIRYFDVSEAGGVIVAEYQTGIYSMGLDGTGMKEIVVEVGTDYRFDPVVHQTYNGDITEYAVSPNGKYSAVGIHGEIFITENHKKKNRTVNVSESPWRDTDPVWTSDTTLVFLSDREGQYDIFMVESADDKEKDLFNTLKHRTIRVTSTDEDES
ncbi:MAG TPA: hypothetical protein VLA34_07630, partial [Candidatus Krumholzibacterium sp.]|nr:hypothetical protein [Candidatus Krumholzibacterium sp.]